MTDKKAVPFNKRGDLRSLREAVIGPISVFIDSGEVDENGKLVMEEYEDAEGETKLRPKLDTVPFLSEVYVVKNYLTKKVQDKIKSFTAIVKEGEEGTTIEEANTADYAATQLEVMVARWDLKDDDKTVPPTKEALLKADVPIEFMFSILNAIYEYRRIPKALSGKSPNTSAQTE